MIIGAVAVVLGTYLFVLFLWVLYLSVTNLARARDTGRLTHEAGVFGIQVYYFAYTLDILVNWSLLSLILLDIPREATMTTHLNRMLLRVDWRRSVAEWLCRNLLDPFDPDGCHCKHPPDEHQQGV